MDENPNSKRGGCGPVACGLIGVAIVLALYVLSIGPAYRFVMIDAPTSMQTFDTIYAPLLWIADSETPPGDWLYEYMNWWLPLPPDLAFPVHPDLK